MTLSDIKECSLRSITVLGSNTHSQITMENLTLPKAVKSTVKNICSAIVEFLIQVYKIKIMNENFDIFSNKKKTSTSKQEIFFIQSQF